MTGAEILVDALKREGVDLLFGYPGGSVIPVFDALCRDGGVRLILTRHEQGAAHAADGYARATGRTGVCLVTSGPGGTNTITGIATARLDSVPMVVISGQVRTDVLGMDAFQEADMAGLTRPICKHNYLVRTVAEMPQIIKNAFHIARSGRPGPVVVDLPVDVTLDKLEAYAYPEKPDLSCQKPVSRGNPKQIRRLAEALDRAERPVILAGGGVISAGASGELVQLMDKANVPAATTLMCLGGIPYDHELYLGMPGMHGSIAANRALMACDLLIGVGTRFEDRVTGDPKSFARAAVVAHVDIDPAEVGKIIRPHIPIVGDAKSVLSDLRLAAKPRGRTEWSRRLAQWRTEHPVRFEQGSESEILPQYVVERLNRRLTPDAIVVTDVGQHQMWAALLVHHRRARGFISSGGLGTMGFGLPAALGAGLGVPGCPVILISGDGSIQMNIQELATCGLNRLPVKIVVLNNACLGMVRQWQELFWDKRYFGTCLKEKPECRAACSGFRPGCREPYWPDLVRVAEANGVLGLRAVDPSEVDAVIDRGFAAPGPVLMEFMVKRLENVFPMVPGGKPITEVMTGEPQWTDTRS